MANIFLSLYERILVRHPVGLLPETKVSTAAVGATQSRRFWPTKKKLDFMIEDPLLATSAVMTFVLGFTFVCGSSLFPFYLKVRMQHKWR